MALRRPCSGSQERAFRNVAQRYSLLVVITLQSNKHKSKTSLLAVPKAMADFLTKGERSDLMRKIKSKGTGPEKLLLDAIRRLGERPRRYVGTLPGKPDFVFHKERLACFVDGEYWHGVQWRRRRLNFLAEQFSDAAKKDAWLAKIHRNMERDIRNTSTLLGKGWTVLRFWTRDIRRNAEGVAAAGL